LVANRKDFNIRRNPCSVEAVLGFGSYPQLGVVLDNRPG